MIKYVFLSTVFLLILSVQAHAGVGAFFGISYTFGDMEDIGLTAKVLSDDEEDKFIAAAGVSYYPMNKSQKFGIDLSGGYLFESFGTTIGWDFIQKKPQLSLGYVNTDDGDSSPTSTPDTVTDIDTDTDGPT